MCARVDWCTELHSVVTVSHKDDPSLTSERLFPHFQPFLSPLYPILSQVRSMSERLKSFSDCSVTCRCQDPHGWGSTPLGHEVSSEREPLRESTRGTDGSATQRNWLPTGRGGGATGSEELTHPSSQLPDQLLLQDQSLSLSLSSPALQMGSVSLSPCSVCCEESVQTLEKGQHCRRHEWHWKEQTNPSPKLWHHV